MMLPPTPPMTIELAPISSDPDDDHHGSVRRLRALPLVRAEASVKPSASAPIVSLRVVSDADLDYTRPRTRADCADVPRPCPFVGCRHNLYLDYATENGVRVNFPDREPHEMPPEGSCALDVADQGGITLNAAGEYVNLTRERIRQVEREALEKLRHPPTISRKKGANTLAAAMAILKTYENHQSDSGCSPLAEHIVDSVSDGTGDADEESDARRYKVDLPHILDDTVSDEDYSAALHRIWDQWREQREALSRGELHLVNGQYVSAQHLKVLEAVRTSVHERGEPPSVMEIADVAGVNGTTASSRRQQASAILRALRDLGLLQGKRGQLRAVEGEAEAAEGTPRDPELLPIQAPDTTPESTQEAAE